MKLIFRILFFVFLLTLQSVSLATSDTTVLNKEKWERLTKDLDYSEEKEEEEEEKEEKNDFKLNLPKPAINSTVLKFAAFAFILIFIIFLLYKLRVFELVRSYFNKGETIHKIEADTPSAPLRHSQELFAEAIKEKDKKVSLRLLYLASLHALSERNLLKIRKDITNSTYIRSLKDKPVQKDFKRIVQVHELTWFGEKDVTDTEYTLILETTRNIVSLNTKG